MRKILYAPSCASSPCGSGSPAPYVALRVVIGDDGVAEVTLTGPGKGNAMGPDFWRECPAVFRALDVDDRVRAVIVRGSGATFSYGLDLLAMAAELGPFLSTTAGPADRMKLLDGIMALQAGPDAIFRCRKPVIAALHGWCIGGGLDIAAACDVRLASTTAKVSLREVKVAMVADVGSLQRLPHIIGEGATRELAFTGRDIDAARALAIGLVNEVFPDDAALFTGARALATEMASNPPLVVQGIKRTMNARIESSIADGLRQVATWNAAFLASLDLGEAMAAFAEKRPPKFRGA
jgi:enoyl-CoA hydratase